MEEKKQFEDWQLRLKEEREALFKKAIRLKKFIDNPETKVNFTEWKMLERQMSAMREYIFTLTQRCRYYGLIESDSSELL